MSTYSPSPTLDDVTVLIPVFNAQHGLERTLASFCERAPVRVLVVDDGSLPPIVVADGRRRAGGTWHHIRGAH
jgi:hypothetical protein